MVLATLKRKKNTAQLSIGQLSERTGLSISAIRFYEKRGLIKPARNTGGQRRFISSDIRRLSFVLIAQQLGFPLKEIQARLKDLPDNRTPTIEDWEKISKAFRDALQDRIDMATRMRDRLDGCIGCGCLSLSKCALYNSKDHVNRFGAGPRYLLAD